MSEWEANILEPLNPPQREAVQKINGPVLILAGAGSGKTRTIVHRLAWMIHVEKIPPWKIASVTFTNKAASEMKERAIQVAGPIAAESQIRTYHSLGLYMLRQLAEYDDIPSNFTIWDDADQRGAIKSILELFDGKFTKTQIRYFANQISSYKDELISPDELAEQIDLEQLEFGDILEEIYRMYEIRKNRSYAMDFGDLLYRTVKILQKNPKALEYFQNKFRYFMVDEYQDTNFAQYTLIQMLAKESRNLCVVGDDDQAIYGWRGANVENILNFQKDFPDAFIVKLEQNYRSTQKILDVSNSVIQNNKGRMQKELWTDTKEGPVVKLLNFLSDRDEASGVARIIQSLILESPAHEVAVLYRTNMQSRLIEEALLERNIPYRVYGGISFYQRKEIKDVIAYLKLLVNPRDESSLIRALSTPSKGIGEKSIEKILNVVETGFSPEEDFLTILLSRSPLSGKADAAGKKLAETLQSLQKKAAKGSDLGLLLEELLDASGLKEMFEEEDSLLGTSRFENIAELKEGLMRFQRENPEAGLHEYLQSISLYSSTRAETPEESVVQLMTIHNAKGLEFDNVFLCSLDDDILPHYLSKRDDSMEEERRLLYVAVTRARKRLYMTRAMQRMQQGWLQRTEPSVFLNEIPPDFIEVSESSGGRAEGGYRKPSYSSNYRSHRDYSKGRDSSSKKKSEEETFSNTVSVGGSDRLKPGNRVSHPRFGNGKVIRVEGSGSAEKVHILFEDRKSRKFLTAFAKLTRLD